MHLKVKNSLFWANTFKKTKKNPKQTLKNPLGLSFLKPGFFPTMPRAVAETEHQAGGVPEGQRQGMAEKNPPNRHLYNPI
jgi:hypothetical protein